MLNGFTINTSAVDGAGPFNYEIIGSTPSSPSIVAPPQASPIFNINNGTAYSMVRLRTVDACGNAAINDAGILPLANLLIARSSNCINKPVSLNATAIPNASYTWYKINHAGVDSTQIGTGPSFNVQLLQPSDLGTYLCKIQLNSPCITRLTYTTLDGNCYGLPLAAAVTLSGRKTKDGVRLSLFVPAAQEQGYYEVQRFTAASAGFVSLAQIPAAGVRSGAVLTYLDSVHFTGRAQYRIKSVDGIGSSLSNTIEIKEETEGIRVFPNPVHDRIFLSITANQVQNYSLELYSGEGQLVWKQTTSAKAGILSFDRPPRLVPGPYLLQVRNLTTGLVERFKLLLD